MPGAFRCSEYGSLQDTFHAPWKLRRGQFPVVSGFQKGMMSPAEKKDRKVGWFERNYCISQLAPPKWKELGSLGATRVEVLRKMKIYVILIFLVPFKRAKIILLG